MLLTSNIKEYIQGCISVLFSYKIGNVFPKPAGQVFGHVVLLFFSSATTSIRYHSSSHLSTTFLIIFKKFFRSFAACDFRGQKNETNPMDSFWSVHFISSSGESGIWTRAPVSRPTPLAGAPLQPLEYFSKYVWTINLRTIAVKYILFFSLRYRFSRKRINYYICLPLFCQQDFFFFSLLFGPLFRRAFQAGLHCNAEAFS